MTAQDPLAERWGIGHVLAYDRACRAWARMTPRQREIVTELCAPLAERFRAGQRIRLDQLPELPPEVRPSTHGSMVNAGLADWNRRLLPKAIEAWWYKTQFGAGGER